MSVQPLQPHQQPSDLPEHESENTQKEDNCTTENRSSNAHEPTLNTQSPTRLPPEIWLVILMHAQDPSTLSRTCRTLHSISLSPVVVVQWLLQRFTPDFALLGALAWWTSGNPIWRHWIITALRNQYGEDANIEHLLPPHIVSGPCSLACSRRRRQHQRKFKRRASQTPIQTSFQHQIERMASRLVKWIADKYQRRGIPNRAQFRCHRCNGTGFVRSIDSSTQSRSTLASMHSLAKRVSQATRGKVVPIEDTSNHISIDVDSKETLAKETTDQLTDQERSSHASTHITYPKETNQFCPLEEYQILICSMLISHGAAKQYAFPLLLRFATRIGHLRLLAFLISTVAWQSEADQETSQNVLDLLTRAASKRDAVVITAIAQSATFELARVNRGSAWANAVVESLMHHNLISITSLLNNSPDRITFEALSLASRITTSLRWRPFYPKSRMKAAAGILDAMVRHTPQDQLEPIRDQLLVVSSEVGHMNLMRHLVSRGADITSQDNLPLLSSVLLGNLSTVRSIIKEFPNVNPRRAIGGAKSILMSLIILDHFLIWYCAITATIALASSITCSAMYPGSTSSFIIFGIIIPSNSSSWCLRPLFNSSNSTISANSSQNITSDSGFDGDNIPVWQTSIVWFVFSLAAAAIQWIMPTHGVIASICVCSMSRSRQASRTTGLDADTSEIAVQIEDVENSVVDIDD